MANDGNKRVIDKEVEKQIIESVLEGNTKYFEILIRKNHANLYKVGESFSFKHEEVEDLIQETHIIAFFNLGKFKHESSYTTWVTRIMINNCLQILKKARRKYEITETDAGENRMEDNPPMFAALSRRETEKTIMDNDLKDILGRSLDALSEDYRRVIILKELEGYSTTEVADMLSITEGNVRIRLKRAKAMLKLKLNEFYDMTSYMEFRTSNCDFIVEKVMGEIRNLNL